MQLRDRVDSQARIETALLRFLCCAKAGRAARSELLRILAAYNWSCHDNTIFFECIRELFARHPAQVLEHLPAALTRRGFPDMPCESLAAPSNLTPTTALALVKTLPHMSKPAK